MSALNTLIRSMRPGTDYRPCDLALQIHASEHETAKLLDLLVQNRVAEKTGDGRYRKATGRRKS